MGHTSEKAHPRIIDPFDSPNPEPRLLLELSEKRADADVAMRAEAVRSRLRSDEVWFVSRPCRCGSPDDDWGLVHTDVRWGARRDSEFHHTCHDLPISRSPGPAPVMSLTGGIFTPRRLSTALCERVGGAVEIPSIFLLTTSVSPG